MIDGPRTQHIADPARREFDGLHRPSPGARLRRGADRPRPARPRPRLDGPTLGAQKIAIEPPTDERSVRDRKRSRRASPRTDRRPGSAASGRRPQGAKPLDETAQHPRDHRLGAAQRDPPRREVDAVELLVGDLVDAQTVGEVRRHRDGRAVGRDGPQPHRRPGEEELRGNQGHGSRPLQRGDDAADETHVVVERKPADPAVDNAVGSSGQWALRATACATTARWLRATGFGSTVVPDENCTRARSSARSRYRFARPVRQLLQSATPEGRLGRGHRRTQDRAHPSVGQHQSRRHRPRACARSARSYSSSRWSRTGG